MLETYLSQTIMAMIAVQQQAPGTEVAGLAFAIATLCSEMLDNLQANTDAVEDGEKEDDN